LIFNILKNNPVIIFLAIDGEKGMKKSGIPTSMPLL